MKPQTLSLTGFRSYPHPVTVDFTGKSLVAALGDTGAGKSSLLDAIAFALFRKSSWDAKEPRQLIADGVQAMSVELTFLHEGQRWRVHRTMHTTNPNAARHHLENLDTGEETDGATAVDVRIKTVLQMSYETFLRVGLLPQGRFDQLLTAPPKERSARLRELFGAESLESIQRMAHRQRDTLQDLLYRARERRAPMGNPAQDAAEAGATAEAAAALAQRLEISIDRITALQEEAAAARAAAVVAAAAAQTLSTRTVTNFGAVLDALESVAADLAARRDTLDRRAGEAAAQEGELTAAITAAETRGEGREALIKAAVILETLAVDAGEYRSERDRFAVLTTELADELDTLTKAEADLAERTEQVEPLAQAAQAAAKSSELIRATATKARTQTDAALTAAHRVADTARAHTSAVGKSESLQASIGPLEDEATAAEQDVTSAETHRDSLQLRDQAAAIATELHPGDDCPICQQRVPVGFEPAAKTEATELSAAKAQLDAAKAAHRNALDQLAEARAAVTAAVDVADEREREHQSAQHKAQEATAEAVASYKDLAALADESCTVFDAVTASRMLLTAASAFLADPTPGDAAQLLQNPERDATEITEAIAACEQAATRQAEQLQTDWHRRTAEIAADRRTLAERKVSYQRRSDQTAADFERHTRAVAKTAAEASTLPARIQALLPDDVIDVVAEQAATAAAAVTARQVEVQSLFDQRDTARAARTEVVAEQGALDREAHTKLERPLNELRGKLNAWAEAASLATTHITAADHDMPKAPTESGIAEVRQYAAQLSTTAAKLGGELTELSTTSADRVTAAQTGLGEHATALADIEGFDPAADLTSPQALHPLVAAKATATKEAADQRARQQEAQNLIKQAADLDLAIAAGEARYAAVEILRRELVDAKFLGHLTLLRTRALLGVASDLLGQMSDGRFGFADTFDIVSRDSGVVHHPNRLSGGEKFLASLALALALAELHSRSGSTLGSLFLDEGFGALDATALESALEVLRTQAGSDRLVMVISHLHAVAEAVDDVLWVERSTTGSSARWLTPAQRSELVQADLASGLQALTR